MPPPSCTGIFSPIDADDLADRLLVLRPAGDRAVQVDQVQPLCALLEPVLRHRPRILGEHRPDLHVALLQAHAMAVLDVDGGDDQHGVRMAATAHRLRGRRCGSGV